MSIYDEKNPFKFNFSLKQLKLPLLAIVVLISIVCVAWLLSIVFSPKALQLKIEPNPLNLADVSKNGYAILTVKASNITSETASNVLIEVEPISKENLVVFPTNQTIQTLGLKENKSVNFTIRPNPAEKIFAGDYEVNVTMKINEFIYKESAILTIKTE